MESRSVPSAELHEQFGDIDIYLFDQLQRGRFDARRRVLDAGCGGGRNLPYFLAHGFEVYAIDEDPGCSRRGAQAGGPACAQAAGRQHPPGGDSRAALGRRPDGRRRLQRRPALRARPRPLRTDGRRDVARARARRPLLRAPGVEHRHRAADQATRSGASACPTARIASSWTSSSCSTRPTTSAARCVDPLKTTNVQNQRCMTTWVIEKNR